MIITEHGRPVARLVSVITPSPAPDTVAAGLREARAGVYRGEDSIRNMTSEGQR